MKGVEFRPVTPEDAPEINQLFHTVFGKSRSQALWEWLYRDTPGGPGSGVVGLVDGDIIAHGGLVKRPFQLGREVTFSGQSIDAMTHPAWQRKGLNQELQRHLIPIARENGIQLIYGFSNENSTPGILRYQDRTPLSPFPLVVRPVRLPRFSDLGGTLPPSRAARIPDDFSPFDPPLEHRVGTLRSLAYLQWRYRKPGGIYREVVLREGGILKGLGLLSIRKQGGVRVAFISDFLAPREAPKLRKELLEMMIAEARSSGCILAAGLAFPGSADRPTLTGKLFVPVPGKLQMENVVFSVRDLSGKNGKGLPYQADGWDLSWGAHDLV